MRDKLESDENCSRQRIQPQKSRSNKEHKVIKALEDA